MQRERGFSLIELMVALVMTLIVSGAIYGLMTSGQGAFRREPALIDRQQNIRVAMDMIVRDLENAGAGMSGSITPAANSIPPPLSQVFTTGLNSVGIPSAMFAGQNSDQIEFFTADGSCPAFAACQETTSGLVTLAGASPASGCMGRAANDTLFAYVSGPNPNPPNRSFTAQSFLTEGIMFLRFDGNLASACTTVGGGTGAGPRMQFTAIATPGINNAINCVPGIANPCLSVVRVNRVRYELAGENPALPISFGPPANPLPLNPPCLWRSEYGRFNRDGTLNAGPNPNVAINPFEMVARGIDDLQVDYQAGGVPMIAFNAAPGTGPVTVPPVVPALAAQVNTDSVVRRVRITLSARAVTQEQGGSRYVGNALAEPGRRGQLTTIVTPRPALATLAQESDQNRNWR